MKCIIMPYGNAGWGEKQRIVEEIVASRPAPPFIYNDVLVLVHSSRMKRMYGRLFLDLTMRKGSSALVPPHVQTLHQFLQTLYEGIEGPQLMDENSRLVLLEGLVKERLVGTTLFSQGPDVLAPSLSAALAKMIEQLSAAGVMPEDLARKIHDAEFADKQQVMLLLDVYSRYQAVLKQRNLTDPAGMRLMLRDHFDPAWLAPYRTIIIDGIQDAGRLETDILRNVVDRGCTYLVDAPSGDLLDRAAEFHPLRLTRDFLSALGTRPEQGRTASSSDDLFLASSLFSDRSFAAAAQNAPSPLSFSRSIDLLSTINMREEVSLIAGRVKRTLREGMSPDAVLVAFPSLDEYGPLVEEIFNDCGIPYNRSLGRQLSTSPVATAVISLLRPCQEDFSGPSLLRIFSSTFLRFSGEGAIVAALDRLMREKRITGGREKLRTALIHRGSPAQGTDTLTPALSGLFTALEPFCTNDPATLSQWMDRLENLIAWSGLGARVATIHGPLNINLQAFKKLEETLGSLSRAGKLFPHYSYTFNEWLFLLKKTFMHARFQVPPEDEGGVQVLGIEESMGLPWNEIYLGGLVDGKFPQRLPQNIFLPEATLETLGVRTLEKARLSAAYHFYRLLLSANKIVLSWPENEGDRSAIPSPFLMELAPLRMAGLISEAHHIQSSLKLEHSNSLPELAKAISLSGDTRGLSEIITRDIPGMAGIRSATTFTSREQARSLPRTIKRSFRVTELDDYLACPYDYYVKHLLGLRPLEEPTEDISALDRGSTIHAILRNFYLAWTGPITCNDRAAARELLRDLTLSAFGKEADTVRNRREKDLFLNKTAERFLDAEEEFWKQGMRPVCLEQTIKDFELILSNNETVVINGKIDRIDVDENGNFIIVDYKTGDYPESARGVEQKIFQLPVYAAMAQRTLSSAPPFLKKPIGLAYYDLKGKKKGSARDVVLFNKDARDDHPASKPQTSPKSEGEFEMILAMSMDKARKAVEGILAGEFSPKPQDRKNCRYCQNKIMCGDLKET